LDQVGKEHDFHKLEHDRLTADRAAEPAPVRVLQDGEGRRQRQESKHLDEQAADQEVEQIFTPFVAKDRLLSFPQQSFDGDEDDAHENQVEQEPIQPQVDIALQVEAGLSIRAAERGCQ
jgi:hypothetical protein